MYHHVNQSQVSNTKTKIQMLHDQPYYITSLFNASNSCLPVYLYVYTCVYLPTYTYLDLIKRPRFIEIEATYTCSYYM